jgi:hypothetical protein
MTTKTYTALVIGHGLWGAGDTEKEALKNVPYSTSYMREKGYTLVEFNQPVQDIEVGPLGCRWTWTDPDSGTATHTETERLPRRKKERS